MERNTIIAVAVGVVAVAGVSVGTAFLLRPEPEPEPAATTPPPQEPVLPVDPVVRWEKGIIQSGTFKGRSDWFAFTGEDGERLLGPGGWYRVDLVIENGRYVGARYAAADGTPARIHGVPNPDRKPFITGEVTIDGLPAPEGQDAWSGWFAERDSEGRMTALHLLYHERPINPVHPGWSVQRISYAADGRPTSAFYKADGTEVER